MYVIQATENGVIIGLPSPGIADRNRNTFSQPNSLFNMTRWSGQSAPKALLAPFWANAHMESNVSKVGRQTEYFLLMILVCKIGHGKR